MIWATATASVAKPFIIFLKDKQETLVSTIWAKSR